MEEYSLNTFMAKKESKRYILRLEETASLCKQSVSEEDFQKTISTVFPEHLRAWHKNNLTYASFAAYLAFLCEDDEFERETNYNLTRLLES